MKFSEFDRFAVKFYKHCSLYRLLQLLGDWSPRPTIGTSTPDLLGFTPTNENSWRRYTGWYNLRSGNVSGGNLFVVLFVRSKMSI